MYPLKKRQNTTKSPDRLFDPGPMMAESNISQPKEVIDDILSMTPTIINNNLKKRSSMLVFQVGSNKEILIDKLPSFDKSTLITESSPISEVALTSPVKDSRGFWKESSKEQSKKLWLPKETASQGLDLTCLNGFSSNMVHSSFQILQRINHQKGQLNSLKTSWQSSPFSQQGTTVEDDIRYCRKIRVYPTKNQKLLFEECFRATRYVHNQALEFISKNPNTSLTHISLRKNTMLSDKQLGDSEKWLSAVPYDTRQLVLKQLASNFKTNFTLLKKKLITHFEMSFKSKKNPYQIFFVDKNALDLKSLRIFKRRLKEPLKIRKRLQRWVEKNKVESDLIMRRENNRYYLCLPMKRKSEKINQPFEKVALDPGVRTFQTFYSDQGIAGKLGDSICESLIDIGLKEDKLKSLIIKKTIKRRTRHNLKNRCFLLRTKIKNIVKDLHWKSAHYLCSNFKHILIPSFEVSKMVSNQLPERARSIGSKSVRKMLLLSPSAFKERLIFKAKCLGATVEVVNEAYTTKTCGQCGSLKDMGYLKVYECHLCGFELDRDYNGARNIFLKYI